MKKRERECAPLSPLCLSGSPTLTTCVWCILFFVASLLRHRGGRLLLPLELSAPEQNIQYQITLLSSADLYLSPLSFCLLSTYSSISLLPLSSLSLSLSFFHINLICSCSCCCCWDDQLLSPLHLVLCGVLINSTFLTSVFSLWFVSQASHSPSLPQARRQIN